MNIPDRSRHGRRAAPSWNFFYNSLAMDVQVHMRSPLTHSLYITLSLSISLFPFLYVYNTRSRNGSSYTGRRCDGKVCVWAGGNQKIHVAVRVLRRGGSGDGDH